MINKDNIVATKWLNVVDCRIAPDRYLTPTQKAIDKLALDMKAQGQLTPILVRPINLKNYEVIDGATRLKAATKLSIKHIHANVISASETEYKIIELMANVARRELTGEQRREMRAKIKALQTEHLAAVKAAKGGRGKKGGAAQASRDEGIPRTTVRRRIAEAKPGQNTESGQVSGDELEPIGFHTGSTEPVTRPKTSHASDESTATKSKLDAIKEHIVGIRFSKSEVDDLDEYIQSVHRHKSRSDAVRDIIRNHLKEWRRERQAS